MGYAKRESINYSYPTSMSSLIRGILKRTILTLVTACLALSAPFHRGPVSFALRHRRGGQKFAFGA